MHWIHKPKKTSDQPVSSILSEEVFNNQNDHVRCYLIHKANTEPKLEPKLKSGYLPPSLVGYQLNRNRNCPNVNSEFDDKSKVDLDDDIDDVNSVDDSVKRMIKDKPSKTDTPKKRVKKSMNELKLRTVDLQTANKMIADRMKSEFVSVGELNHDSSIVVGASTVENKSIVGKSVTTTIVDDVTTNPKALSILETLDRLMSNYLNFRKELKLVQSRRDKAIREFDKEILTLNSKIQFICKQIKNDPACKCIIDVLDELGELKSNDLVVDMSKSDSDHIDMKTEIPEGQLVISSPYPISRKPAQITQYDKLLTTIKADTAKGIYRSVYDVADEHNIPHTSAGTHLNTMRRAKLVEFIPDENKNNPKKIKYIGG